MTIEQILEAISAKNREIMAFNDNNDLDRTDVYILEQAVRSMRMAASHLQDAQRHVQRNQQGFPPNF